MREPIVVSAPDDEKQGELTYYRSGVEQRSFPTRSVVGMRNGAILAAELSRQRQYNGRRTVGRRIARGRRRSCGRRPARRVIRLWIQRLEGVNGPAGDDQDEGGRRHQDDRRTTCSQWPRRHPLWRWHRFRVGIGNRSIDGLRRG